MKDPRIYLEHIKESIRQLRSYVAKGEEAFLTETIIQDASYRKLQVIAESVKNLPDDIRKKYPEINWRALIGFRNILVHDYLGVDPELTWNLIIGNLDDLETVIDQALQE